MQRPWTSITLIALLTIACIEILQARSAITTTSTQKNETEQLRSVVQRQFQCLDFPFPAQYNRQVEQIILSYLLPGRRATEYVLGRSALYFPIFEHYLKAKQLPLELKYIPFIESRLQPYAQSSVGAMGLWQFMPATARQYRLKTSSELDERLDPHRATEAAVELLAQLYDEFGDWSLALAAYNCGPGRVRKAMRETGCDTFWDIQGLLPRQTQRYIPAFLAAIYVAQYYMAHDINPKAPRHLPVDNYSLKVHQRLTFEQIAATYDLSVDVIRRLNPGYIKRVVPSSGQGRYIILPAATVNRIAEGVAYGGSPVNASEVLVHHPPPTVLPAYKNMAPHQTEEISIQELCEAWCLLPAKPVISC